MAEQGPTDIWATINRYYQATRKPVHVAVGYSADAAAASLTLASLLKASLIAYDIEPVASTEELQAMVGSANLAQEYARPSATDPLVDELFILIGLGAAVAIADYFDLQRHVVVVLDAYRPFHLRNLREADGDRLLIWNYPTVKAEVDEFFRSQREIAARRRRRRRRREAAKRRRRARVRYISPATGGASVHGARATEGGWDSGSSSRSSSSSDSSASESLSDDEDGHRLNGNDNDDDDDMSFSQSQERIDWMDPDGVPPYLEAAYYGCERGGRSCAVEAHDLAVLLNRFRVNTLWHAAVGVCDLFLRGLVDYAAYLVELRPLHDAVTLHRSVHHAGRHYRDGLAEDQGDDGLGLEVDGSVTAASALHGRTRGSSAMELHTREAPQLHLLQHTSLWEAIWYHPTTAAAMRLHHAEDGEGALRQLLARCGVSTEVAWRPWREVPLEAKSEALPLVQAELRRLIESRARFLNVPNAITTVSRTVGFSAEVSAFDACALHTALLASAPPPGLTTLEASFAGDMAEARRVVALRLRDFHREQFWRAYAVLDMDPSCPPFATAVQESLALQRAVDAATAALMQPGILQSSAGLHFTIPSDPTRTTTALESFGSVHRLRVLARRLLLTLTVERGLGRYTRAVRPLLITCALPRPTREECDGSFATVSTTTTATTGAAAMLSEMALNTVPLTSGKAAGAGSSTATAGGGPHAQAALPSLTTAAAVVGGGGGGAGALGGAWEAETVEYLTLLVHEGTRGAAMTPIAAVGRLLQCLHDREEFDSPPTQRYISERGAVVAADRATAAHLADIMYLACLHSRWDPQREYLAAVEEGQPAVQPPEEEEDDTDSDGGADRGGASGSGHRGGGGGGGDAEGDMSGETEEEEDDDDDMLFERREDRGPGTRLSAGATAGGGAS